MTVKSNIKKSSELAPRAPQPTTIADLLKANKAALAEALPRTCSVERFLRVCLTTIARNPDLQRCTAASLYGCILQSAQLGLEPGLLNQAHLVPYWNQEKQVYEAQFQIGYMGLRTLAERYGDIVDGDAQTVRERDTFAYTLGTAPAITHQPPPDTQDRGDITHFYAWAIPKVGVMKVAVMTREEIEAHRDKYVRRKRDGQFPPSWTDSFEAMGLKTVMRRLYKLLARSPELQGAIALDERAELDLAQGLGAEMEQAQLVEARAENAALIQRLQAQQANAPVSEEARAPHNKPQGEHDGASGAPPVTDAAESGDPAPTRAGSLDAPPAPGVPATEANQDPTIPHREALRALLRSGGEAPQINAWWRALPEPLKQDLYPAYSDAMKTVRQAGRKP